MTWLLDTLVWTGVLIALVLAVRQPVARHFGAKIAYALWALPLLRLIMPPLVLEAPTPSALPAAQSVEATPELIGALRGKQVDVGVEILGPTLTQIKAGAFRALAVTGKKRSSVLPDVPTAVEAGVKGFQASSWNALAVPGKTPRPIIDRLNKDIVAALAKPDVRKKLADLNIDADQSTPDEAAQLLASDIQRWAAVIQRAGIPKQ